MSTWILGFDASTPRCVVVAGTLDTEHDRLVAWDDEEDGANQASARLVERLQHVLQRAGIEPPDLDTVACGRGPGTFTGTRVAIATAKGLAVGLRRPLLPVSTLAAVAASDPEAGLPGAGRVALLDARRGEVYGGLFVGHELHPVGPEQCGPVEAILESVPEDLRGTVRLVGSGVEPYRDRLSSEFEPRAVGLTGPSPEGFWQALVAAHRAGDARDPAAVTAVYLRQSYAELGINKPKRPVKRNPFL